MLNYSTTELHRAALWAAFGGTAVILYARIHTQNAEYVSWFDNLKKPSYSLKKLKHFAVGGTISSAAFHASLYLIDLEGAVAEHNHVRLFVAGGGLAGLLIGVAGASSYVMYRNRCSKHPSLGAATCLGVVTTALTWATGFTFYKISPLAGYLMVPPALWMLYGFFLNMGNSIAIDSSSVLRGIQCLNREDCNEHGP